ncbi:MAG TPA: hypothetical protein VKG25_15600 [Bryobacteraceae bacterium]|nr:hypothetical protein [Bryobacteraceae bacterium]
MIFRTAIIFAIALCLTAAVYGQELTADAPAPTPEKISTPILPGTPQPDTLPGSEPIDKRILGVLTNYRTANMDAAASPMTAGGKMTIAAKDSFDYPSYLLAIATSGFGQLANDNASFGQGVKGYAHRYVTGVADQVIGNMLTEGIMPSLLHEDPRYFRMATGPGWTRLRYALTRTLVTRTDAGSTRLNYSEIIGNGIGAGIGNAYYPDGRHLGDNFQRWGTQIATDTLSNVIKEFWPDVKRKFRHH